MSTVLSPLRQADEPHCPGLPISERSAAEHAVFRARRAGDRAPGFMLSAAAGGYVVLYEELRRRPMLVHFERGPWCPASLRALRGYSELTPELAERGVGQVAVTPQLLRHTQRDSRILSLSLPVLSDSGNIIAQRYGLAMAMSPALRDCYAARGVDLADLYGPELWQLPLPASYLIDGDGSIRRVWLRPDYGQLTPAADLLIAAATEVTANPAADLTPVVGSTLI